jgi:carnitine O-acetyltransferase
MIIMIHREANERSGAFMDHAGQLRDLRTGSVIIERGDVQIAEEEEEIPETEDPSLASGYSFFDSVEVDLLNRRRKGHRNVGKIVPLSEY